jgi:dCTP deaminase
LHIDDEGYELLNGTIKPNGGYFRSEFSNVSLFKKLTANKLGEFRLDSKTSYVFKVKESFTNLPENSNIYGLSTAKSTIGRVDVITRLIVDGADEYDKISPRYLAKGNCELFLEITPLTFPVIVRDNVALSQLRLFYGSPSDAEFNNEIVRKTCLHGSSNDDGSLSVDLTPDVIGGVNVSAFEADRSNLTPILLWKQNNKPDPCQYWFFRKKDEQGRLRIKKNEFYIFRSKELISLPPGIAVYCKAMDETLGEMRIHYAGFVHPWFGKNRLDGMPGTALIFEVRGHDVDVNLCHGEKLAKLTFYRMSENYNPDKAKKKSDGYNNQKLTLSGLFDNFPQQLEEIGDGKVRPLRSSNA